MIKLEVKYRVDPAHRIKIFYSEPVGRKGGVILGAGAIVSTVSQEAADKRAAECVAKLEEDVNEIPGECENAA